MATTADVPHGAAAVVAGPFGATGILRANPSSSAPSEQELARAAHAGDRGAFEALVLRFQGPLFRFLNVRTGCAAEAEELVQESFLRAWRKLDLYDPERRFSTWLFTVAKRVATSRARTRRPATALDETLPEPADGARDPARAAADRDEHESVWKLAAQVLSREQRSALWLRYAEDLSPAEIGRILGKRGVTVRVLLFRAREVLARHLEDEAAGRSRRAGREKRHPLPAHPPVKRGRR